MFYDDDELERVRWRGRRRLRLLVILLEALVCVAVIVPVGLLDRYYRPGALQPLLDRAVGAAPVRLVHDDVVMLPVGTWDRPSSWRFAVTGLAFRPLDPKKPEWSTRRITMSLPRMRRGPAGGRVVHWDELVVDALVIRAHQQRPPLAWTPSRGPIELLTADRVVFVGATYAAAEDPPLGAVDVQGIDGVLGEVRFDPGRREVSGTGSVTAASFRTGAIEVTGVDLPVFRLDRSSMHLEGTVDFAGSLATLTGDVRTFHVKPEVTLDVELQDASVHRVVETATGRDAPVTGRLDLSLHVEAGGRRPRGGAIMHGDVLLREGRIQLDPRTRYVVLDLVRIAPWVRLDAERQVQLEDMRGSLTLTRGSVTLRGLRYPVGRRMLQLDGTIAKDDLYLSVRLRPPPERPDAPGLGVIIEGAQGRPQSFRLAQRIELLKERAWLRVTEADRELAAERDAARERAFEDELPDPRAERRRKRLE